jgi:hypothetical protein
VSIINHIERIPNSRKYADALVDWMRNGVAQIDQTRLECGQSRIPLLRVDSGNLVVRFQNPHGVRVEVRIVHEFCTLTAMALTVAHPEVQQAIADKEIKLGKVTLRFSGNMAPEIRWTGECVYIDWPSGTVHCDVAGVPKFLEPYLRAIRIYPGGLGDCVFSNDLQNVRMIFE